MIDFDAANFAPIDATHVFFAYKKQLIGCKELLSVLWLQHVIMLLERVDATRPLLFEF